MTAHDQEACDFDILCLYRDGCITMAIGFCHFCCLTSQTGRSQNGLSKIKSLQRTMY